MIIFFVSYWNSVLASEWAFVPLFRGSLRRLWMWLSIHSRRVCYKSDERHSGEWYRIHTLDWVSTFIFKKLQLQTKTYNIRILRALYLYFHKFSLRFLLSFSVILFFFIPHEIEHDQHMHHVILKWKPSFYISLSISPSAFQLKWQNSWTISSLSSQWNRFSYIFTCAQSKRHFFFFENKEGITMHSSIDNSTATRKGILLSNHFLWIISWLSGVWRWCWGGLWKWQEWHVCIYEPMKTIMIIKITIWSSYGWIVLL